MDFEPIRVLVSAFAPVPGANPHAAALRGMAAALRAEVDFVSIKTEALAHVEHFGAGRMFRVPISGTPEQQRGGFGRAIRRQLDAQSYDVVHVRGPFEGLVVGEAHRELGFRFVYEVATFPDEAEGAEVEQVWGDAHTYCLEEADLVLVPTEAATRALAERGFAGKVAVVQPGVDIEMFDWWPAIQDEVVRLLYLGSFAADRDLGTLLGAIRKVHERRPVRALVAGEPDPDRRARLRTMVKAFELQEVVEVRGEPRASSLPSLIAACDVGLVPASATPRFQEIGDLPQPLLEYLACRRPVVAAGVPGVAEVVRDEREGLLYLPGDEDTLAEAIQGFAERSSLGKQLAEAGYERVRRELSSGARRRRIAEVYEMLMPGSQSYDAWDEAFDRDDTGQLPVPPDAAAGDESSAPADVGDVHEHGLPQGAAAPREPADAKAAAEDTSPEMSAPRADGRPTTSVPGPNEAPQLDTEPGLFGDALDDRTKVEPSPLPAERTELSAPDPLGDDVVESAGPPAQDEAPPEDAEPEHAPDDATIRPQAPKAPTRR